MPTMVAAPVRAERLVGVGSPFANAVAQGRRHLAPRSSSIEAYRRWCAYLDIADPDLEFYPEMCALNGWTPDELPVAETAVVAPAAILASAPAQAEIELDAPAEDPDITAVIDGLLEDAAAAAKPRRSVTALADSRAVLRPGQAAARFVEWVRLAGRCGTYTHQELAELTAEFFAAEDIAPIAEHRFRQALVGMRRDVARDRSEVYTQLGSERVRSRTIRWTIHDADADTTETIVPWKDLPLAKRAA